PGPSRSLMNLLTKASRPMPDIRFRSAAFSDIDALVALEESVERALPHRDMFATDGREFYVPIVAGAGHILLAEDREGRLAGVSVIRFPVEDDDEHLGIELGFSPEQRARVLHLESVFVRPDCQGRKLAQRLIRENMRLTEGSGRTIACATVWPHNFPSLRLHLELGLYIRAFALKYGGKPRFILCNDGIRAASAPPIFVPSRDVDAQKALLAHDHAGVALHSTPSGDHETEYRLL
ncbi:N-acetyltransferase family protein, partial [Mailhella sp.]|uniref:N-acetyltransferase family protein n=1 Tax=Mailhella sp. TaxID=1981029 RepID=UPI0040640F7C